LFAGSIWANEGKGGKQYQAAEAVNRRNQGMVITISRGLCGGIG
jgi:hypothetical protein